MIYCGNMAAGRWPKARPINGLWHSCGVSNTTLELMVQHGELEVTRPRLVASPSKAGAMTADSPPSAWRYAEPASLARRRKLGKANPIAIKYLVQLAREASLPIKRCPPGWHAGWIWREW